jgi:hypothetical protein
VNHLMKTVKEFHATVFYADPCKDEVHEDRMPVRSLRKSVWRDIRVHIQLGWCRVSRVVAINTSERSISKARTRIGSHHDARENKSQRVGTCVLEHVCPLGRDSSVFLRPSLAIVKPIYVKQRRRRLQPRLQHVNASDVCPSHHQCGSKPNLRQV